jgi:hypothetical protein
MSTPDNSIVRQQDNLLEENSFISEARQRELTGIASSMLDTFFQARDLGTLNGPVRGRVWPWVRFLTWDRLRPRLGQGISHYADIRWRDDDKYMEDLSALAKKVSEIVPENVNGNEWRFITRAAYSMLLERVSPEEEKQITMGTLMRGNSDEFMISQLDAWADIIDAEQTTIVQG